jgi:hypothetical protein
MTATTATQVPTLVQFMLVVSMSINWSAPQIRETPSREAGRGARRSPGIGGRPVRIPDFSDENRRYRRAGLAYLPRRDLK